MSSRATAMATSSVMLPLVTAQTVLVGVGSEDGRRRGLRRHRFITRRRRALLARADLKLAIAIGEGDTSRQDLIA